MIKNNWQIPFFFLLVLISIDSFTNDSVLPQNTQKKEVASYKPYLVMTKFLLKENLPFSAVTFFKRTLALFPAKADNSELHKVAYELVLQVGSIPFLKVNEEELLKGGREFSSFILGKKYYEQRNFAKSMDYFNQLKMGEFYYLHALYHLGTIFLINEKYEDAYLAFQKTALMAPVLKKKYDAESHTYLSLEFIQESSEIAIARTFFKMGNLAKARDAFKNISTQSYFFPEMLYESSWNYYRMGLYEQSVGKLLTFEAPFMENYFYPEGEIIKGLTYMKLCRWDDMLDLIKNYRENYKQQAVSFINFVNNSKEQSKYIQLMIDKDFQKMTHDNFMLRLLKVIQSRPGYISLSKYFGMISAEKKYIEEKKEKLSKKLYVPIQKSMKQTTHILRDFITLYIQKRIFSLGQEIINLDNVMTEMELFVYSKIKKGIYKKGVNELTVRDKILHLSELNRLTGQYYFNFNGEFWADELGAYLPIMKSKCLLKGK